MEDRLLEGKRVLLGVTGGIAAYKSCELARQLIRLGAAVQVVMTEAAVRFVAPLTFEALTHRPVVTDLFQGERPGGATVHVELARWPHLVVVAPATYDFLGKLASGLANDALSALVAATRSPVILCPAMNHEMYAKPALSQNLERLRSWGYRVVGPEHGELAEGEVGWGRLAALEVILDAIKYELLRHDALKGCRVLVTAGPTQEAVDPVRFITNHSSGKMGYALAEASLWAGAEVALVSGPTGLRVPEGVRCTRVRTASEMAEAVAEEWPRTDILFMAAAVSDYRPTQLSPHKIKKGEGPYLQLTLEKTPDILAWAGQNKGSRFLVGFAVETENELAYAMEKLRKKNLDLIVVNNPLEPGAGFGTDTNRVTLLDAQGHLEAWPLASKLDVARRLVFRVGQLWRARANQAAEIHTPQAGEAK
ncbi:MAG: bifunctional phosphopantothenoylcysteine decarboxylase/phosphopantothenate--cysteine ligase CoaBC [candidate division KSB1 bacterium]|nr:bifunctional phosphopantothenoylcysteine decarboxylase/phosphopantothenate--cysteine ligase CoaBC [candidate division KSB1 bacterium]